MTGQIYCDTHGDYLPEFEASSLRRVWSQLLAAHGSSEHRACDLSLCLRTADKGVRTGYRFRDEDDLLERTEELELECIRPGCKNPKRVTVQCTEVAIAVHQLAFHSVHEGHGMVVTWGGDEYARSPAQLAR